MKQWLKRHRKAGVAVLLVVFLTIMLFPRHAVWKQFSDPMGEFKWLQTRERVYVYERKFSAEETQELLAIWQDTTRYDLRKVACDREPGVFDGELQIQGTVYGVDLTSGLFRSDREIGWLKAEQIQQVKLLCQQSAASGETDFNFDTGCVEVEFSKKQDTNHKKLVSCSM